MHEPKYILRAHKNGQLEYEHVTTPHFFDQMSRLLIFSLFILVWLLIKGGYYFSAA